MPVWRELRRCREHSVYGLTLTASPFTQMSFVNSATPISTLNLNHAK